MRLDIRIPKQLKGPYAVDNSGSARYSNDQSSRFIGHFKCPLNKAINTQWTVWTASALLALGTSDPFGGTTRADRMPMPL
tara:strand:+ start:303 stop:542 length:240 start_codon:yes stop_codon:yes gene_type:complete